MVVCKSGVGVNSMLELLFESRVCPGALWHTEESEGEPSAGLTVATTDQSAIQGVFCISRPAKPFP